MSSQRKYFEAFCVSDLDLQALSEMTREDNALDLVVSVAKWMVLVFGKSKIAKLKRHIMLEVKSKRSNPSYSSDRDAAVVSLKTRMITGNWVRKGRNKNPIEPELERAAENRFTFNTRELEELHNISRQKKNWGTAKSMAIWLLKMFNLPSMDRMVLFLDKESKLCRNENGKKSKSGSAASPPRTEKVKSDSQTQKRKTFLRLINGLRRAVPGSAKLQDEGVFALFSFHSAFVDLTCSSECICGRTLIKYVTVMKCDQGRFERRFANVGANCISCWPDVTLQVLTAFVKGVKVRFIEKSNETWMSSSPSTSSSCSSKPSRLDDFQNRCGRSESQITNLEEWLVQLDRPTAQLRNQMIILARTEVARNTLNLPILVVDKEEVGLVFQLRVQLFNNDECPSIRPGTLKFVAMKAELDWSGEVIFRVEYVRDNGKHWRRVS